MSKGADALVPADSSATTLMRYRENNTSAAVAFRASYGVVAMGFPFECIVEPGVRDQMMKKILKYLTEDSDHGQD